MKALRAVMVIGAVVAGIGLYNSADAQTLRMGIRTEPSMDPHFHYLATNVGFSRHIYEQLIARDANGDLVPALAESWENVDDKRWRFHLRKGVKFHDGSTFTAEDVVFSFERIPNVPNNPGTYAGTLKSIERVEVIDPHTIDIVTDEVNTQLPNQFVNNFIVSKKAAEGKETNDFRSGIAAVGTGPFKFVEYIPGQSVTLIRNDDYWGKKSPWAEVKIRIIPNDAARVAALLGGDLDLADFIPPSDVAKLRENKNITIHTSASNRSISLKPNFAQDNPEDVRDSSGKPLGKNPMRDKRVREAMSLAINRDALVDRVMNGMAIASNQFVAPGNLGYDDTLPPLEFDPSKAKKLLAEAGYPDGFGVTLHCTNDRYVNDAKVCQAVGQMLSRVGINTEVVAQPGSVFFPKNRAPAGDYVLSLGGWGSGGEADHLWSNLMPYDKATGLGVFNTTKYENPQISSFVGKILKTIDRAEREKLEKQAMKIAVDDYAQIPLYHQTVIVGTSSKLNYQPHIQEQTLAMNASPAE